MSSSLVSVIVPCYNQSQFLAEALDSVLVQCYENWECIIINDGSPDNTEEVALRYCQKDNRFVYLKKENGGICSARNEGIRRSSGNYIFPLDADDKIGEEYFLKAVEILDKDSHAKVVYAEAELFGIDSGIWELPSYSIKQLALENMIPCSGFFRKTDFNKYGGYDESFSYGLEDWEFWLRILKDGGVVKKLPSVQFYYRKAENSRTKELLGNDGWNIEMRNKLFLKHFDLYAQLFGDLISIVADKKTLQEQLHQKQLQLDRNQLQLNHTLHQIKLLYESRSYRLGNFILKNIKYIFWKK